ncbi:MAG: NADP-dependent oxidoreductase [Bacteroidales bacterium]|jgi:NADPH:quinone reductase-like Zn-dependent oxidoreductase|nr:NADP-dependent oxidoreductase [Bacteroidales bacterium]
MKTVRIQKSGSFEQLKVEDIPVPEINDDQVLVKVYAASVNHLDMLKASGGIPVKYPWIPGHDFSGIIEKVGKNVFSLRVGEPVYGNCPGGSYAEYLAADINKVVMKPDNLSFPEAASVPHVAETAWQAIHQHGQLRKGQKVLIHAAAGGVGAFAVQFARIIGATIYGTASGKDIEYVKSLGADQVIDFKTADFTREFKDMDLVLSLVRGDTEEKSYTVLKDGGRLVSTVGIAHEEIAKKHNITAIGMVIQQSAQDLEEITTLIKDGKVRTDIALTYPLDEAATSWKVLSGDPSSPKISHGKIVLEIVRIKE